jgi:hypothetical protein
LEGRHRGAFKGQRSLPLRNVDSYCPNVSTIHLAKVFAEKHILSNRIKLLLDQLVGIAKDTRIPFLEKIEIEE